MADHVLVSELVDGIAIVTLNRPEKKNALSIAVRDEFSDALDTLAARDAVKLAVVTGAGDTFSAGFDLREFDRLDDAAFAKTLWASSVGGTSPASSSHSRSLPR